MPLKDISAINLSLIALISAWPAKADGQSPVPDSGQVNAGSLTPTSTAVGSPSAAANSSRGIDYAIEELNHRGIYPKGYLSGEYYGAAAGDYETRSIVFLDAYYGLDFDMARLLGIHGTYVRFALDTRAGGDPSGVNNVASSAISYLHGAGPNNTTRLNQMVVEQHLLHDRVRMTVGRSQLVNYFATSNLYCHLQVGICSTLNPTSWSSNSMAPFWPVATWAGLLTVRPTDVTYIRVGAEASSPTQYTNGGFPWRRGWAVSNNRGVHSMVEAGYQPRRSERYDLGAYDDTTEISDYLYNSKGQNLLQFGGSPETHRSQVGVYGQAEYRFGDISSEHNSTTVFGGFLFDLTGHSFQRHYFVLGLLREGVFRSASQDYLAVKLSEHLINGRAIEFGNDYIRLHGGDYSLRPEEVTAELDYSFLIAGRVRITPFVYFVHNPDHLQTMAPDPRESSRASLSSGIQLSIPLFSSEETHEFGLLTDY